MLIESSRMNMMFARTEEVAFANGSLEMLSVL
jgi:hypothetical protein